MLGSVDRGPKRFPPPRTATTPVVVTTPRYDPRLFDLAFAFLSFRDALSLPFLYLLLHYFLNVGNDDRLCPFASPVFGVFLLLQMTFVVIKRLQGFYSGQMGRLWWQLEIAYALFLYPWGTAMFILAKPTFYAGAVTNNEQCDLYHHPMAQVMWMVAEVTCTGAGLGMLLLGLAWAWDASNRVRRIRRIAIVVATQVTLAVGWNVLTVQVVAPWANGLL